MRRGGVRASLIAGAHPTNNRAGALAARFRCPPELDPPGLDPLVALLLLGERDVAVASLLLPHRAVLLLPAVAARVLLVRELQARALRLERARAHAPDRVEVHEGHALGGRIDVVHRLAGVIRLISA